MHGQASHELFYWMEGHLTDIPGPKGDWRGNKRPQDSTTYGQICGSICMMQRKPKRSKSGLSRNQISIMPGNYVVSFSWNQMMNNFHTPWKTQWWNLLRYWEKQDKTCLYCRSWRSTRIRLEGAPRRYHEDHVAGRGMNHEDHIVAKGIHSLSHCNLVYKFVPMPQALKIPDVKAAVEKNGKIWKAWQLTKVRNKNEVIVEARNEGRRLPSREFGAGTQISKIQMSSRTPRWQCKRWFRIVRSIHWARIMSITNDCRNSNGCHIKATRMCRTSSQRSINLHLGQNGRCTITIQNSEVRMSKCLDTSTKTQMVQSGRSGRSSWAKCERSSFGRTIVGQAIRENPIEIRLGEGFQIGNAYSHTVKKGYPYLCMWMTSNWLGRNKTLIRCGKYSIKKSIWENQHLSLTMCIWVALKENAKQARILWIIQKYV